MNKSELKKLIKEAAKDLQLQSKPTYVGKLSEEQLNFLQEQDGVAAGSGIYGANIINEIQFATYVGNIGFIPQCYTPVLRQLSINTEGSIYNLNSFNPDIPSEQHGELGTYIPTCRNYSIRCVTKEIGSEPYQIGECFTWNNNNKIECVVGFSTDTPLQGTLSREEFTPEALANDGQYDVNNNGVPDHIDCSGANWTGNTVYGCTDNGDMGQAWWEQVDSNTTNQPYQTITGFENYPSGQVINYNPNASIDDGTCNYPPNIGEPIEIEGCTDPEAVNYNPEATEDDGSCQNSGCMDPSAENFNSNAVLDINEFENEVVQNEELCVYSGCTDSNAINFDPVATIDDGSCIQPIVGCMIPEASNYNSEANTPGLCIFNIPVCGNPEAENFITDDIDGLLLLPEIITIDELSEDPFTTVASDYVTNELQFLFVEGPNSLSSLGMSNNLVGFTAVQDNELCIIPEPILGCMDQTADNFNGLATEDDGSCEYSLNVGVCNAEGANNFIELQTFEAGNSNYGEGELFQLVMDALLAAELSPGEPTIQLVAANELCIIPVLGCTDPGATNFNPEAEIDDGSCEYPPIEGCTDPEAINFNPEAEVDNGTCEYPPIEGCTDPAAPNYNSEATIDDGSCIFKEIVCYACINNEVTSNTNGLIEDWNEDIGVTFEEIEENNGFCGTLQITPGINTDYYISPNHPALAKCGDVKKDETYDCIKSKENPQGGCTLNPLGIGEFDSLEECEKSGCGKPEKDIPGCTDPEALNYNPEATEDDGSCKYDKEPGGCAVFVTMVPGSTPNEAQAIAQGAEVGPNNRGKGHYCSRCAGAGGGNPQQTNFPVIIINNTDSSFGALGNIFIPMVGEPIGNTITWNDGNQYVVENYCECCNVPSGCTDPEALNFDQAAFVDDGSCEYPEEPNDYSGCIPTFCPACQEFENALATNPNATPSNPAIINTCLSGCCEDPAIQKQYLGGISYGGPYPNIEAYASNNSLEEQVTKRLQKLANIKK